MLIGYINTDAKGAYLEISVQPVTAWGRAHAMQVAYRLAADLVKANGIGTPVVVTGGWHGSNVRVHIAARDCGKLASARERTEALTACAAQLWLTTGWRVLAGVRITRGSQS